MYWAVSVAMLPPTTHPTNLHQIVALPQCHSNNQMWQLKDRIRQRLDIPGVRLELSYGGGTGRITVSDDATVEEVVQAIAQVQL